MIQVPNPLSHLTTPLDTPCHTALVESSQYYNNSLTQLVMTTQQLTIFGCVQNSQIYSCGLQSANIIGDKAPHRVIFLT
jgi:hypothetical protein